MQIWKSARKTGLLFALVAIASVAASAQGGAKILKPAEMTKLIPQTVFYRGQTATTQLRNSSGIKFEDGSFVLASMVDTSGYSTGIAAKYQAYFITEVPIKVAGKKLTPGAYGIGFIEGNKFVVTDLGAHEVLVCGFFHRQRTQTPHATPDPARLRRRIPPLCRPQLCRPDPLNLSPDRLDCETVTFVLSQ